MAYKVASAKRVDYESKKNSKACEICGQAPENTLERTTKGETSHRHMASGGMVASVRSNRVRLSDHASGIAAEYGPALAALYVELGLATWAGKMVCIDCAEKYSDPHDWYYNRRRSSTESYTSSL